MKQQLQKKLISSIVAAMMFSVSANAQIVYTDVIPDTTITCSTLGCIQSYNLDLNNDGIVDFTLNTAVNSGPCLGFGGFTVYRKVYVTSQSGNGTVTLMLNANDTIGSNLAFSPSGTLRSVFSSANCSGSGGNWTSTSDHYLGLQITVGASIYYGWARLNVVVTATSSPAFTLKDYAYNTIPNQPILAGQTVATGLAPHSLGEGLSVRLFPNPATNQLTIGKGQLQIRSVKIFDLTGREVYSEIQNNSNANSEIKIDVSKFPASVYAVQIQTVDFTTTKKLVIEK